MHVDRIYKGRVPEVHEEEGRCAVGVPLKYFGIIKIPQHFVTINMNYVLMKVVRLHPGRSKYKTQSTV